MTDSNISGWGSLNKVNVKLFSPINTDSIKKIIENLSKESIIARGLGRSYGDAAQLKDGNVILLDKFNNISLNEKNNSIKVGAGVSFSSLLSYLVPKGFFLPVTPGTKNITVGGAIASDIHGKNHHQDGSFGNYVTHLTLIDGKGEIKQLGPGQDFTETERNYFWATIGGMGLTGIIIDATFSLFRIETSLIKVYTERFYSLENLMTKMIEIDKSHKYSVAWVDSLNDNFRSVLTYGDHACLNEIKQNSIVEPLRYNQKNYLSAPKFFPFRILNKLTIKAFNEAWFRKSSDKLEGELQSIEKFFYPLDGVQNWNRVYGNKGFLQYQFAVPEESSFFIEEVLRYFKKSNLPHFLTVLKRFGEGNKSLLSFPIKGWTLATDIPAGINDLEEILDKLDNKLSEIGGKIYLSKDARMNRSVFLKFYEDYNKWLLIKQKMDPNYIFVSDLFNRLRS